MLISRDPLLYFIEEEHKSPDGKGICINSCSMPELEEELGLEPRPLDSSFSALSTPLGCVHICGIKYLCVYIERKRLLISSICIIFLQEGADLPLQETGGVICCFTPLYSTELDYYLLSSMPHPVGNDDTSVTDLQ